MPADHGVDFKALALLPDTHSSHIRWAPLSPPSWPRLVGPEWPVVRKQGSAIMGLKKPPATALCGQKCRNAAILAPEKFGVTMTWQNRVAEGQSAKLAYILLN